MAIKFSKPIILIAFVSFFTDIASEMLYPIMPVFLAAVLGASMTAIGGIEGAAIITAGLLKGYFGGYSDKIGKRAIFVAIGYSLSALVKPLPGIFQNIPAVITSRVLDRVGKGIRTAPRDALLAGYAGKDTGSVFGFHRAMDTLGASLGPVFALILLYFFPKNYQLVFIVAFVPSLFAIALALNVKDNPDSFKEKKSKKFRFRECWKVSSTDYKIVFVALTAFSFANSSDVFLILKTREITNSDLLPILAYIFYNIIYASVSFPLGNWSDKVGKKPILAMGMIIFSFVYLGFGFINSLSLIFVLFLFYGIYAASTEGISKALVADLLPDELRGTGIGLLVMSCGLGETAGSLFAGVLWDSTNSAIPFIFSAILSFISGFVLLVYPENKKYTFEKHR